jgi:hypothetical protein
MCGDTWSRLAPRIRQLMISPLLVELFKLCSAAVCQTWTPSADEAPGLLTGSNSARCSKKYRSPIGGVGNRSTDPYKTAAGTSIRCSFCWVGCNTLFLCIHRKMTVNGATHRSHEGVELWRHPHPESTEIYAFQQHVAKKHDIANNSYAELWQWSIDHPSAFWEEVWHYTGIKAHRPYDSVGGLRVLSASFRY